MTEVYVLCCGQYSDERPAAVFTTLQEAQGQLPVTWVWKDNEGEHGRENLPPDQWWTWGKLEGDKWESAWSVYQVPFSPNPFNPQKARRY